MNQWGQIHFIHTSGRERISAIDEKKAKNLLLALTTATKLKGLLRVGGTSSELRGFPFSAIDELPQCEVGISGFKIC